MKIKPLNINFGVLYSNKKLLDKYYKNPPTTWDELLETGKYILEQEKNNYNNTSIIGYVGHMPGKSYYMIRYIIKKNRNYLVLYSRSNIIYLKAKIKTKHNKNKKFFGLFE